MYVVEDINESKANLAYSILENSLETQDLLNLVNDLPAGYRTVFNLYAIEGYSHKEIAGMLDINENTSKSQLSRARAQLQKKLKELELSLEKTVIGHEKQ